MLPYITGFLWGEVINQIGNLVVLHSGAKIWSLHLVCSKDKHLQVPEAQQKSHCVLKACAFPGGFQDLYIFLRRWMLALSEWSWGSLRRGSLGNLFKLQDCKELFCAIFCLQYYSPAMTWRQIFYVCTCILEMYTKSLFIPHCYQCSWYCCHFPVPLFTF